VYHDPRVRIQVIAYSFIELLLLLCDGLCAHFALSVAVFTGFTPKDEHAITKAGFHKENQLLLSARCRK
jgi:hypothetical protein